MKNSKVRKGLFLLITFLILTLMMDSCLQFRMSKTEINTYFSDKKEKGKIVTYSNETGVVNYVIVGDTTKPLIIFVHGSPGSLSAFIDFLGDSSLVHQAQLISMDRPGFGASNFGKAEPSLVKQARLIKAIIEKNKNNRPVYLVGHSLGGPLIARVAIDFPELVDGLIMVAPSIDPSLEPNEWFRGPLATPFFSWILPRSFRASNEEIYQLKPQLEAMMPLWSKIVVPTIVIQGKKDRLVPYENALFAKEKMVNAPVTLMLIDSMNHFVPWTNPELINSAITGMIHHKRVSTVK